MRSLKKICGTARQFLAAPFESIEKFNLTVRQCKASHVSESWEWNDAASIQNKHTTEKEVA